MAMKYSYMSLLYLFFLLGSCGVPTFISGKYKGKNPHVFVFSEDSTFRYECHDVWYSESFGRWRKAGNVICLTSFQQRDRMPVEYMKTENSQSKGIVKVKINASDNPERDYICFPYVNGVPFFSEESLDVPPRGSYSFNVKELVDSISFVVAKRPFILRGTGYKMTSDDVRTDIIYPHLLAGETLEVTVNIVDSLFGYSFFKNEGLKLKNKKIIFQNKGNKYKLYLTK